MSEQARRALFLVGGVLLFSLLIWAMYGLPAFGHNHEQLGLAILASTPIHRHALAVVTAVNFDYRGLDTLGEEFILYAAVTGVALVLRSTRKREKEGIDDADRRDVLDEMEQHVQTLPRAGAALRLLAAVLVPVLFFFGLYVVVTAHISLGGGFQGGVIIATAWLLIFLAGGNEAFHYLAPKERLEIADALGAGGYALVGFTALLTGATFLQNFLPLGKTGSIASAGTIPVINFAVSIAVAAGFILIFHEFIKILEQRKVIEKP